MVGIYSLFVLGVGTGGPAYVWLIWIPVIGMLFVALVFGELASHYPVAGALYQYSKFSVGAAYGWFVGWFYGLALLITVAAVDTGVVTYVTALTHNWFDTSWDPTDHTTILVITVILLAIQTTLNITGVKIMGRVAQFGVYVEIVGTLGIAIILAIHGFNHDLGFLFSTENVQNAASNPLGLDFGGNWLTGAALIAILAPVYIFYGFEAAGDISEETADAGRRVPRSMRLALIWGGIASFILIASLLLAMPETDPVKSTVEGGGVPFILSDLSGWLQDFLLVVIIFAFFSCGTSIQGAGSRLAFSFARDGALPASRWLSKVHPRFNQRACDRGVHLGALRAARLLLTEQGPRSRVHHVPGERQRPRRARVIQCERYLPRVPPHGHRRDRRSSAWVDSGGQLPPRQVGVDRLHHRRGLSRRDVGQHRRAHRADQPTRVLQHRLDHDDGHGRHRGGRGRLLPDRATGQEGQPPPARRARADRRRTPQLIMFEPTGGAPRRPSALRWKPPQWLSTPGQAFRAARRTRVARMRISLVVLVLVFAGLLAVDLAPSAGPRQVLAAATQRSSRPAPATVDVPFVRNGRLVRVERIVPPDVPPPVHALRELLQGPTRLERRQGMRTAIPAGARLRSVRADGELWLVSFSRSLLETGSSATKETGLAQIAATLAPLGNQHYAAVATEGRLVTTLRLGMRADPWRAETGENDYRYVVRGIQLRLSLLGYLDGADVTGSSDYLTEQALVAFQGWEGLDRTGSITGQTQVALFTAHRPEPAARRSGKRIEIYRDRGVLLMIETGEVLRAVHASTGMNGVTPAGSFEVYVKALLSWSVPFKVWMPYAAYFRGGIATHQSPDVPSYPASHGCVRLPEGEAERVYHFVEVGTPVTVR